jgi:CheY-like chemotaxis protein
VESLLQLNGTIGITAAPSPLVTPAAGKKAAVNGLIAPKPDSKMAQAARHILVVEDNLVNQKVLCRLLRNRGFIVKAANHGLEALEAIRSLSENPQASRFDVVLCDIEMPIMGGIPFAKEVRALESEGKEMAGHVPIIGVTANVRSQQVSAAIEAGMVSQIEQRKDETPGLLTNLQDGVTTKPYRIDDLVAHINRVCDQVKNGGVST